MSRKDWGRMIYLNRIPIIIIPNLGVGEFYFGNIHVVGMGCDGADYIKSFYWMGDEE